MENFRAIDRRIYKNFRMATSRLLLKCGRNHSEMVKKPWFDEVMKVIRSYDPDFDPEVKSLITDDDGYEYIAPILYESERKYVIDEEPVYGPEVTEAYFSFPWKWDPDTLNLTPDVIDDIASYFA